MDNEAKIIEILLKMQQIISNLQQDTVRIKITQETNILPKIRYLLKAYINSR